jgi:hypothetical protein
LAKTFYRPPRLGFVKLWSSLEKGRQLGIVA